MLPYAADVAARGSSSPIVSLSLDIRFIKPDNSGEAHDKYASR